jgi:hypothetical protein
MRVEAVASGSLWVRRVASHQGAAFPQLDGDVLTVGNLPLPHTARWMPRLAQNAHFVDAFEARAACSVLELCVRAL